MSVAELIARLEHRHEEALEQRPAGAVEAGGFLSPGEVVTIVAQVAALDTAQQAIDEGHGAGATTQLTILQRTMLEEVRAGGSHLTCRAGRFRTSTGSPRTTCSPCRPW